MTHDAMTYVTTVIRQDDTFVPLEEARPARKPDYVEVRRREDLAVSQNAAEPRVVLGAARLGTTRLIDNSEFEYFGASRGTARRSSARPGSPLPWPSCPSPLR